MEEIEPILYAAARAMAYDINSGLTWKSDENSGFDWLAGPLQKAYARVRYGTYAYEGPGSLQVDIKYSKVHMDTENFFQMFKRSYVKFSEAGPGQALQYLRERIDLTQRSWMNMRERFEMARNVNDEVTSELNRSKALTRCLVVAGNASSVVLGTIVPLHWVVSAAGGVAYSFTGQLVGSLGEAMSSDMVAFQYPIVENAVANSTTIAAGTNAAAGTALNYVQGNQESLLKTAEEASQRLEAKLGQFTAQRGANLTGPQRRIVTRLARDAGGIGGQSTAARAGSQLTKIKAGSIGVGLLFMIPDFIEVFKDLRDVAHDATR